MFFMILVESSQAAQRNLGFCKISSNASAEKGDCVIDCMPYGLELAVSAIMKTDYHFLRYCVPMDNQRPELDLKFYKDICPDANGESLRTFMTIFDALLEVPVIVVFTKYDQFLRNVEMHLFDYPEEYPDSDVSEAAKKQFREHYLRPLGDNIKYVRLESKFGVKYRDCILMSCERDAQTKRALW